MIESVLLLWPRTSSVFLNPLHPFQKSVDSPFCQSAIVELSLPIMLLCLHTRKVTSLLIMTLLMGCVPLIATPTPQPPAAGWLIVRVEYPTTAMLNQLAAELDVWEVQQAAGIVVARVTLAQYDALQEQQLAVTLDCAKMQQYAQALGKQPQQVRELIQQECH